MTGTCRLALTAKQAQAVGGARVEHARPGYAGLSQGDELSRLQGP